MATKKQLEALAKGREKLTKTRELNGLKDLFKRKNKENKSGDKTEKPIKKKKTTKKNNNTSD